MARAEGAEVRDESSVEGGEDNDVVFNPREMSVRPSGRISTGGVNVKKKPSLSTSSTSSFFSSAKLISLSPSTPLLLLLLLLLLLFSVLVVREGGVGEINLMNRRPQKISLSG